MTIHEGFTSIHQAPVDHVSREPQRVAGPVGAPPHADTLNGSKHANMKELRVTTQREVLRVAFAFDPSRAGILLVGGDKAGVSQKRFYRQLIEKADRLYDALAPCVGDGQLDLAGFHYFTFNRLVTTWKWEREKERVR